MKTLGFLISVLLVGCNLKLDPSVNPNLSVANKSDGNGTTSYSNDPTTQKSRIETKQGTKQKAFNIWWGQAMANELHIDTTKNCVQLVTLSTGEYVVDAAAVPCPASDALLDPNAVLFTLTYQNVKDGEARVLFNGRPAGTVNYDWDFPAALMDSLCTGAFQANCILSVSGGLISGIR